MQVINLGLYFKSTHQVLTYVDNFNLQGDGIRENVKYKYVLSTCEDIGLAVNIVITKFTETGRIRARLQTISLL